MERQGSIARTVEVGARQFGDLMGTCVEGFVDSFKARRARIIPFEQVWQQYEADNRRRLGRLVKLGL